MAAVKDTSERRNWVREVLVGVTVGLGSNLLWLLAQAAVHSLG